MSSQKGQDLRAEGPQAKATGGVEKNDQEKTEGFGAGATVEQMPALKLDLQQAIGRKLRTVFEEITREPVPQHLLDLVDKLARKEGE